jgi:hypothetical protein
MVRNLSFSAELASSMNDPRSTCRVTMDALFELFRRHIYSTGRHKTASTDFLDRNIVRVLESALKINEPHLNGSYEVSIMRGPGSVLIADIFVDTSKTQKYLESVQPGTQLLH